MSSTVVIGSGFEVLPEQINLIRKHTPVISNSIETIYTVKDPKILKQILDEENINFPHTVFKRKELISSKKYLVKKIGANGGAHIFYESSFVNINQLFDKDFYYQEFINGQVHSAVFLANGHQAKLIGLNRLLQSKQFIDQPFLYEGAITVYFDDQHTLDNITHIINKITKRTNLFGLCGIDFIIDEDGSIFIIDINPRPPTTFELHESEQSLFLAHIDCFNKGLINYSYDDHSYSKGHIIYYAKKNLLIPKDLEWPSWVRDRPHGNQQIAIKNPVCSIYAEANKEQDVYDMLINYMSEIELFIKSI